MSVSGPTRFRGAHPLALDSGDIAWVIAATALVMIMTPALGFFYGGLVRRKNLVSTIAQFFPLLAVVSLVWTLWGYTLALGPPLTAFIGSLDDFGVNNVGTAPNPGYSSTIPELLYFAFQLKFAAITPALIIGAFAERIRFKALLIYIVLWTTFVYVPIAHWNWGVGGWLKSLGVIDFAGGLVVHTAAGVSAVCGLVAIPPASGYVGPMPSIIIGLVAGVLCNYVGSWRARTTLDDSLDVFACHGAGGIWGTIATGLFASSLINPGGPNGLFFGNPGQLGIQALACVIVAAFAFAGSYVILRIINLFTPVRVSPAEEDAGLDISGFGEEAYVGEAEEARSTGVESDP